MSELLDLGGCEHRMIEQSLDELEVQDFVPVLISIVETPHGSFWEISALI